MSKLDGIISEILYDAVDTYVSENIGGIVIDICNKLTNENPNENTEGQMSISCALSLVIQEWLSCGGGYSYIRDDMERQAENSCDYEYDCERIIFEYGFTRSLETAKEYGVRLSDTDESEVAQSILLASLPSRQGIKEEVERHIRCSGEFMKLVEKHEKNELKQNEQKGDDA